MPDFAWADWAQGQVERVWDLMDISVLRAAVKGVDPSFKTYVRDLIRFALSHLVSQPSVELVTKRRPFNRN